MAFRRFLRDSEFWVLVIFVIVLAARLYIAFQTPYFNYDAYFSLRQVEHIKSTGVPLYDDPLSYGGKTHLFAPLHYYAMALFSIAVPIDIVAKILPNIFAACFVILAYFMSLKITKSHRISMITAFMAGFIPILFFDINKVQIDYLALLLVFGTIYCMLRVNERKYVDYALILIFLLVLTSPLAFILVLGLLLYLLLSKMENIEIEMKELEIILFFTFLVFWVNLLIYKNAFLSHGLLVVWQNIPVSLLSNFFDKLTFLEAFYTISIIPLILGIYSAYIVFHTEKRKDILMLVGFGISCFVLLWFKLISLVTGLVFLSATLVIMTSFALKRLSDFVEKTKIHRYQRLLTIILLLLFIVTAIVPSVIIGVEKVKQTPEKDDVEVLQWAAENIPKNVTIAATLEEGNLVAYYTGRKNIMDTNFLLTPNIDQRYTDLNTIFNTRFETEAVRILNDYKVKYIFFSSLASEKYGIAKPAYVSDLECFSEIYYIKNISIYQSNCKIR